MSDLTIIPVNKKLDVTSIGFISFFYLIVLQQVLVFLGGEIFNALDEILIVVALPFFTFYSLRLNRVLGICLSVILFKAIILYAADARPISFLGDLLVILKPQILFWSFLWFFGTRSKSFMIKHEKIVSGILLASVFYGGLQFVSWFVFRAELPMSSSKFFQGTGQLVQDQFAFSRASGFFGHPLWFGYLNALLVVSLFYKRRFLLLSIPFLGVLLSFSRWALFLTFVGIGVIMLMRARGARRLLLNFTIGFSFIVLLFFIGDILEIYESLWSGYNKYAIKIYGIEKGWELLKMNPFGYGIGSFGTMYSVGGSVYELIHFDPWRLERLSSAKSGIESFVTILAVQLGVDGLILYFLPFLAFLRKISSHKVIWILLIVFPLVSMYNQYYILACSFYIIYFRTLYEQNAIGEGTSKTAVPHG